MKRKGVEDINDDFPLSFAIKIRRLDGNLIADEEQLWIKPPMVSVDNIASSNTDPVEIPAEVMVENDERAIVLFKPLTTPLFQSPSNFRVSIDPGFLSEIKYNQFMSRKQEERDDQVYRHNTNQCLAVVPWMPSRSSNDQVEISELMIEEDEQMEMDIDEDSSIVGTGQTTQMNENLHCMIEQAHNSSSPPPPLVWFR